MSNTKAAYPLTIQNVVCNFSVDSSLSIEYIVEAMHGRYDAQVFPACVSSCQEYGYKEFNI